MKRKVLLVISCLILFLAIVQIFLNIFKTLSARDLIDFAVYQGALEAFLTNKNPYQFLYGVAKTSIPFNYPPGSLLVMFPLHFFPLKAGEIALSILSIFLLGVTLWIIQKLTDIKLCIPHFLLILAFFVQTFPTKFTLILGQINFIVLGSAFLSLFAYIHYKNNAGKEGNFLPLFISVILFALSATMKLFPLYVLPLFLVLGDFMFFFAVLIIFLLFNLLPSVRLFEHYFFSILPSFSQIGQPNFYDQSIFAFFVRITNSPPLAKNIAIAILLMLYLLTFLWFRSRVNSARKITKGNEAHKKLFASLIGYPLMIAVSLVFAIFSIGNFFSWQHHLVFSFPLIFLLYLQTLKKQNTLKGKLIYNFLFLIIWLFFVFHFKDERNSLLSNPFTASYQTILVLLLVLFQLCYLYGFRKIFSRS